MFDLPPTGAPLSGGAEGKLAPPPTARGGGSGERAPQEGVEPGSLPLARPCTHRLAALKLAPVTDKRNSFELHESSGWSLEWSAAAARCTRCGARGGAGRAARRSRASSSRQRRRRCSGGVCSLGEPRRRREVTERLPAARRHRRDRAPSADNVSAGISGGILPLLQSAKVVPGGWVEVTGVGYQQEFKNTSRRWYYII